jgi:ATP-binding cassette, subfamily B, bacterial
VSQEHTPVGLLTLAKKALPFVHPFRWGILSIVALTLVTAAMDAVEPLLMKFLFDGLVGDDPMRALALALGGLLGLAVARQVMGWMLNVLMWRTQVRVNYGIQRTMVDRMYSLPLAFQQNQTVGGLATKMDRGLGGLSSALWAIVTGTLPSMVYLAISFVLMYMLDWRLFLLVLAFIPLPPIIGAWAAREQTQRERLLLQRWTRIYSRLHEVLAGISTVKSFGRQTVERRRFMRGVGEANRIVLRGIAKDTAIGTTNQIISIAARISGIGLGGYLVVRGEATIGTVVVFNSYIGGIFGPVQGLTGIYQTIRRASVSLETIFEIMDAPDTVPDLPGAKKFGSVRGEVVFENVSFSYIPGEPVIREVNLHVRPQETVAFVGPSGVGKTTLMSLLQRFYDPEAGAILLDGFDLRTIQRRSLSRQIGVVLQDSFLFNDSIRNNIAYPRLEASEEEIVAAAKAANAHPFISQLPDGYDTLAGERGSRLSAGQRQRIAIARALIKNAPILILDEATSALDTESESLVQEALKLLMRGRTTFIIAHRLSTVVDADRIVVMHSGRIEEIGSHRQLIHQNGYYASLVNRQSRGLLLHDLAPA